MLMDAATAVSEKQVITATAPSQKVIDLGPGYPMSGNSNGSDEMRFWMTATKAFVPTTNTLTVQLRTSNTLDANGKLVNPTVLLATGAILGSSLKAGAKFPITMPVPPEAQRYIDLNYVVSANFTSGEVSSALVVTARTI